MGSLLKVAHLDAVYSALADCLDQNRAWVELFPGYVPHVVCQIDEPVWSQQALQRFAQIVFFMVFISSMFYLGILGDTWEIPDMLHFR